MGFVVSSGFFQDVPREPDQFQCYSSSTRGCIGKTDELILFFQPQPGLNPGMLVMTRLLWDPVCCIVVYLLRCLSVYTSTKQVPWKLQCRRKWKSSRKHKKSHRRPNKAMWLMLCCGSAAAGGGVKCAARWESLAERQGRNPPQEQAWWRRCVCRRKVWMTCATRG